MSENSKPQNQIEIPSKPYEGTSMRIKIPKQLERLVVEMQQALYDYDFLSEGLLPEETSYYKLPGKHLRNKSWVTVYMMLLVQHWIRRAVDHQKQINRKLREKIQNQ